MSDIIDLSKVKEVVAKIISQHDKSQGFVTINLRDKSYTSEGGGFHPVEIGLIKLKDGSFKINYITDFAYMGNYYPELERFLDFNFEYEEFYLAPLGWLSMVEKKADAKEMYQMWEMNFISYYEMGAFDEIEVTVDQPF